MTMTTTEKKRVVITGMGAITPIGNNLEAYWQGLLAGKSGIGPITLFDASKHKCRIAGEVKGFDPLEHLDAKDAKRTDRFAQFAIAASKQALVDARSEEHTSELQSLTNLVCRLLLEKKKEKKQNRKT